MSVPRLVEFLIDRIGEDEDTARAAHVETVLPALWSPELLGQGPFVNHVARWDPIRVLAECESKRRIVSRCDMILRGREVGMFSGGQEQDAGDILRALALPYVTHLFYREEYAP